MRVVYPSITAGEYLGIIRAGAEKGHKSGLSRRKALILAGCSVATVSIMDMLLYAIGLGLVWVFLLNAVALSAFIAAITALSLKSEGEAPVIKADPEMLSYYRLCDRLRDSGIGDVSMHLAGDECILSFSYMGSGTEKKGTLKMPWHMNRNIDDIIIDLERKTVAVPEAMCADAAKLEDNGGND